MHLVFESYLPPVKADDNSVTLGGKWKAKTNWLFLRNSLKDLESQKEISKCIGIPLATVYRVMKNLRVGRGIERQEGSGRPRELSETDRRRLGPLVRFGKLKTNTFPK